MSTEPWHGTISGYTNRGCRCTECSAAASEYQATVRAQRLAARITVDGKPFHPAAPHGTYGGYTNYGCRCDDCRATRLRKYHTDRLELAIERRRADMLATARRLEARKRALLRKTREVLA